MGYPDRSRSPRENPVDAEFLYTLGSLLLELIEPALMLLEIYLDWPKKK